MVRTEDLREALTSAVREAVSVASKSLLDGVRSDLAQRGKDAEELRRAILALHESQVPRSELDRLLTQLSDLGERDRKLDEKLDSLNQKISTDAVRDLVREMVDPVRKNLEKTARDASNTAREVDQRTAQGEIDRAVRKAAESVAKELVEARWQERFDSLADSYDNADERLEKLRSFIEDFGPGGAPVLRQHADMLQEQVDRLEQQLGEVRAERERQRAEFEATSRELTSLKLGEGLSVEQLRHREDKVRHAEQELEARRELESKVQRLTREVEGARAEVARWRELDLVDQARQRDELEFQSLKSQVEALEQERSQAQARERGARRKAHHLREELDVAQRDLTEHEQAIANEKSRTARIASQEEELHVLRSSEGELRRQLQASSERLSKLLTELDDLRSRLRDQSDLRADVVQQVRQENRQALQDQLDQVQAEVEQRVKERAAGREARLGSLTQELDELRDIEDRLHAAQAELAQAERAAAAERQLRESFEVESKKQQEQLLSSLLQAVDAERERQHAQAQADAARILEEAEAEASRLHELADQEQERLETAESERHKVRSEIQDLTGQLGALTQQVAEYEAKRDGLRDRDVPDEERLGQLRSKVFTELSSVRPIDKGDAGQAELTWLEGVEGRIKDAGFSFHPRLVRSFHTALKIQDQAPLVVLAGISGTGKSELPALYADAGGLPFLPIPVQPSWDSPYDLLGFFNYTDGRLKAEPFARLLDQFQTDDQLGEGLAMVLLDEMNLARVEYYFAELLSRLETRRSVRRSTDADQRRRASVQLDAGPGHEPIDLYLNERLLLVGTMNEDESTLTLSDKVLDRASVITFPAPKGLRLTTQKQVAKPGHRLSWKEWEGWVHDPRSEELANQLNDVNEIMRELGRPFGHRLFRAIHAYLTNYPGAGADEAKEHAWADQVAMKILPRLRGLECQDRRVRAGLERMSAKIPDELRAAFNRSREGDFFGWVGASEMYEEGA